MIDFYRGIDRETGQTLPYLAELSRKISPSRSANANYRAIEQLVEELGSREALNRSRPDDKALLEALEKAKRCFLNEDSKQRYDRQLAPTSQVGLANQEPSSDSSSQIKGPLPSPSLEDWDWTEDEDELVQNSRVNRVWLSWLLTIVISWLLALVFLYFQWPLSVLGIILAIIVCLRLLLDD